MMQNSLFWFRRDLRLHDNRGLVAALKSGQPVVALFILDSEITAELKNDDPRVTFIFSALKKISDTLTGAGSGLLILSGNPVDLFAGIIEKYSISDIFLNEDYEPYGIDRDRVVRGIAAERRVGFHSFKEHVIFSPPEIVKKDGTPYTVYTPYSRLWLTEFSKKYRTRVSGADIDNAGASSGFAAGIKSDSCDPSHYGFITSSIQVEPFDVSENLLTGYEDTRNTPSLNGTSLLGPHIRFGTVSIREIAVQAAFSSHLFLKQLAWREFFIQILYHFPYVVTGSFRKKYEGIEWRNNPDEFERWCNGTTGYPIVDAGMRQLKATGYMHNRVRMITASFLTKDLLIDWRWGEAWFAVHLLDYELASNNGNWQWAAGTGCDASPWFRIFNPLIQQKKFDPGMKYISKWVPELGTDDYPSPVVDHSYARKRTIEAYKKAVR